MYNLKDYLYKSLIKKLTKEYSNEIIDKNYNHSAKGVLIYSPVKDGKGDPLWVNLDIDDDLIMYYRWFLEKKGVHLEKPLWGSHISVIRGRYELEEMITVDKIKEGELIEFNYGDLTTNGEYWWLEVKSSELEKIRENFNLEKEPPFPFHITIGKILPQPKK